MAAVSPILHSSVHAPMPQAHKHPFAAPVRRTCSPLPSPLPLSLTVSGQGAVHDPHGFEGQSILGQSLNDTDRRACPNDSGRWHAG